MTASDFSVLPDTGSFRDSVNRVYSGNERVLRGLDAEAAELFRALQNEPFYISFVSAGKIVGTTEVDEGDPQARLVAADGWAAVLEHEPIRFISYPYEWPFSMLREAALLQLEIIEQAMEHGWTLKDASAFNIQWRGSQPVFIDVGSFERWKEGTAWVGYRQFCSMFLIPLMMKAHLGFNAAPLLRSQLDGIPPLQAAPLFGGMKRFRRGVLSHIVLPSAVENSIARKERDNVPAQERGGVRHSKAMVVGLIQGLVRLVRSLRTNIEHTDWSNYAQAHSYEDADFQAKLAFVERSLVSAPRQTVWDIGCNTGTFSRLASQHADYVLAIDGDNDSIEKLFLAEQHTGGTKILPLVGDIANPSPNQGWGGMERRALDNRGKPSIVLCLALIHHIRVSANIPVPMFLQWLRSLEADIVLEYVDRHDEMFEKLIVNRTFKYPDYTLAAFESAAASMFTISDRQSLKGGRREIFLLTPR